MNKLQRAVDVVSMSANRNSPTILIGLGIGGFVGSIALAIEATKKAEPFVNEGYWTTGPDGPKLIELSKEDKLKTALPFYIPTIASAVLSTTAIILGTRIQLKRTAALAGLYGLAQESLRTYQEKVLEAVGENKARHIQGEVLQDALEENPIDESLVHNVGGGTELCYETMTGRYFYSDAATIQATVNEFNHALMSENSKTLGELLYDFGLPGVYLADHVGWEVDNGLLEIAIGARVATNNQPCLVLGYVNEPKWLV